MWSGCLGTGDRGGGEGGAAPLFVSLRLGDEGVVEKEKGKGTGVKRGRRRPPKKGGSIGCLAKKGGSGGLATKLTSVSMLKNCDHVSNKLNKTQDWGSTCHKL